jgi:hypothetical protein
LPEDYKGKGEPSFSIERALKEHKAQQKANGISEGTVRGDATGIEMQGGPVDDVSAQGGHHKQHSLDGLKRRFGSLRKKNQPAA